LPTGTSQAELRTLWRNAGISDKGNFFEYVIEGLIEQFCFRGAAALDAGANYGAHTSTMLKAVGREGKVIAFEPHSALAAKLKAWQKHSPNLTVVQSALANQTGSIEFLIASEAGYGSIHERPQFDLNITGRVEVAVTTVDQEISGTLDFIKADIEGAEIAMLHGAIDTLRRASPLVVMELDWNFAFKGEQKAADDFFAFVESLGYDILDCFGEPITAIDVEAWNIILVPRKRGTQGAVKHLCQVRSREFLTQKIGWNPYQKLSVA
jgi:FkbM family methyltransferase